MSACDSLIGNRQAFLLPIIFALTFLTAWSPQMDYWRWSEVPPQPYVRETRTSIGCPEGWAASHRTWMVPYPEHTIGRASYYDIGLMEDQVTYRGVTSDLYLGGVALMTPASMLQSVYLKPPHSQKWEGPYVQVDASASHHFCMNTYQRRFAVEVSWDTWQRWGRARGDVPYADVEVCVCSRFPDDEKLGRAVTYWPRLVWRGAVP